MLTMVNISKSSSAVLAILFSAMGKLQCDVLGRSLKRRRGYEGTGRNLGKPKY